MKTMRWLLLGTTMVMGTACGASMMSGAERPVVNIAAERHPNLQQAQEMIAQAWDKVVAAQDAHDYDLGGHAAKAKDALATAAAELKLAAEYANAHKH